MRIRELQENELDKLHNGLKSSSFENGIGERFSHRKEILKKAIFDEKSSYALVAEVDNELAGYLLYSITNRNFTLHNAPGIYIHGLYVEPSLRRKRIGTCLMNDLIKRARDRKLGRIEFSLLRNNSAGEIFLKNFSFEEIDFIKPMRLTLPV